MNTKVNVRGLDMNETLRNVVARQVRAALGPHADSVARVDVRFVDLGTVGHDGGVLCRIRAEVDGLGTVLVREAHVTAFQAVAASAELFADRVAEGLAGRGGHRAGMLEGVTA